MSVQDKLNNLAIGHFVPVELQRRGYKTIEVFAELAARGLEAIPDGFRLLRPWCRWRGLSTYLDCVAYADRASAEIPRGRDLNLGHVTPGQVWIHTLSGGSIPISDIIRLRILTRPTSISVFPSTRPFTPTKRIT